MEWKITTEIVATTSLPVDRLTATDCNAATRAKKLRTLVHNGSLNSKYSAKVGPLSRPLSTILNASFYWHHWHMIGWVNTPWHWKVCIFFKALFSPGKNHQICLASARYICDSYRGIIQHFLSISAGNIGQSLFNNPGMNHPIYYHSSWVKPLAIFHSSREKPTE